MILSDAFRYRRRRQWRTVGVAALAAAAGYATLALSDLAVIRQFGLLLSLTVILSLFAAYLVVMLVPVRSGPPPIVATEAQRLRVVIG